MFDYIKNTYKKGDKLKITCLNGDFSGEILFINEDSIILKTLQGKTCGIKGNEISFFEELSAIIHSPEVVPSQNDTPQKNEQDSQTIDLSTSDQSQQVTESPKDKEDQIPVSNEENHVDKKDELDISQYKPGDVIPLDVLHKIDPKTAKPKNQKKTKATQTLKGLDSLRVLVEDEHKIQNEKYVPAFGEVKFAKPESNFGFITDGKTGKALYFSFSQIVDGSISKSSGSMYHMPVLYSIQGTDRGDMAITIHKPNTVGQLINLAKELISQDSIKHASRVLDHILAEYPDNFSADELKRNLEKSHPQTNNKGYSNLSLIPQHFSLTSFTSS